MHFHEVHHSAMTPTLLLLITLACLAVNNAFIGLLLAQRGLSMLSDGLAHSTFGAIGLLLLLGIPLATASWATIGIAPPVAILLVWVSARTKLPTETTLAVIFIAAMAIGISALSHYREHGGPEVDVESVIFGDVLALTTGQSVFIIGSQVLVFIFIALFGRKIAYAGFYSDMALLSGVRVKWCEYALMLITGIQVALTAKAVGVLVASALLVLPSSISRLVPSSLPRRLKVAMGAAVGGVAIGFALTSYAEIPHGAAIALSQVGIFAVCAMIFGKFRSSRLV
jgi:zinc transport system permease protein